MTIRTNGQIIAGSDINSQNLATCHVVVETYVNGTSWYRVYDDGWVEQGGNITGTNNAFAQITFPKAFTTTSYTALGTQEGSNTNNDRPLCVNDKNTTYMKMSRDDTATGITWYACGY